MASNLKIRNIDFQFPDDISWNWNPGNPQWANVTHYLCFTAPGFERYFIKAIRAAIPKIKNAAIAEEADLFCKQEGAHAKYHLAHVRMLAKKYPGLEKVMNDITKLYDDLFKNETPEFHLAYAAVVEATFTPATRFIVENRRFLFKDTDPRMASFIMWHMMEEYEHRSSALKIYNEVVGSYFYKIKAAPRIVMHLARVTNIITKGFSENIPTQPGELAPSNTQGFLREVPLWNKTRGILDILSTLLPYHNPDHLEQPEWVRQWFKAENDGVDMRTYFPTIGN